MKVTIIEKNKIRNLVLPERVSGSYFITEFDDNGIERNLISIDAENNNWKMMSNNEIFIYENNVMMPVVVLKEYNFYTLKNDVKKSNILIYIQPTYDRTFLMYNISAVNEISIGSAINCNIQYSILEELNSKIILNGEKILVTDNNSKFGIYVNNERIENEKTIEFGDVVFILGLKIIPIKHSNTYYLIINNPRNITKFNGLMAQNIPVDKNIQINDDEEIKEMELYNDDSYFHKKPRFLSEIETLKINVDAPPAKQDTSDNSALLTIGPMLTMSMTSLMTGYSAISSVTSGKTTLKDAMPSLVMCGAMFASIFIWPTIMRIYTKRKKKALEKKRQKKYSEYIDSKRKIISEELVSQKQILMSNYPSIDECQKIILNNQVSLWQRRITDNDFLTVNLGYGDYPMDIDIKYPEEHFSLDEDNLKDIVNKLGSEPKILTNTPFPYSFMENNISAIIGKGNQVSEYVKRILLQIITFSSYDDLKIVVLTNKDKAQKWEYCKVLPHCFSNNKEIRYLATDNDEYKEICYNLEHILAKRIEISGNNTSKATDHKPIYLIITDCIKSVRNYDLIKKILESKQNYGFSLLIINDKITNLPDQCKSFISIENGMCEYMTNNSRNVQKLAVDFVTNIDIYKCAKTLFNIPIEFNDDSEGRIPDKLGFLEMYDVGEVEQLNSPNRWKRNNPILTLGSPVGYGKNGEKINIDLHEKFHGPHGLIAGMTGSGKSEFIISYILSMAINYHPYEVQFILIDYKGGGLTGAFENPGTGVKLPHLVGTITNLDTNEIKRSLSSIQSELKRRQKLFNKARDLSGESTVDIYKYQKMYRENIVDEPISHLFIISDEFAELKKEQPEFMTELISTARIGRSLGVHLILATQKPSGVVDPQIWSNTRFRVCLRVQEKSDSTEVIKAPDAALLKNTGRFYFQVGYNEIFVLGQAAWAGGKYYPSKKIRRNIDTSINLIDNIGYKIKSVETKKKVNIESKGEELPNILNYIYECAKAENINAKPLWLPKIPAYVNLEELISKYNFEKQTGVINLAVGEYDVPSRQEQHLMTLPLTKEGSVLCYGNAGSGKENLLTTIVYSAMLMYSPNEINFYILDFGAEVLKMFNNSPIVGNVLNIDNKEEINNLYKMISDTIEERKELFNDYNGDYETYCKNSGNTVPSIVVMINNYETYQENYSEYDELLTSLTRECTKYGIYFIITVSTPNGLRFKFRQNFQQIFSLQQNLPEDYTTIMGNVNKTYPSKIFGRGIIRIDDVYEFQTALVAPTEEIPNFIKNKCLEYSNKYSTKAKKIPVLPSIVTYNDIKDAYGKTEELILGIEKESLNISKYNFHKNYVTLVTGNDLSLSSSFINPLINQSLSLNKEIIFVINTEDYEIDDRYKQYYSYNDSEFNTVFETLEKYVNDNHQLYVSNNYSRKPFENMKPILCFIIGIENFKSKLNDGNKAKFGSIFEKGKDLGIINYIIVDSIDKIKKNEFESWYKTVINNVNGIWIGNGLNDQFTLKVSQKIKEMKEDVPNSFAFVIKNGKPVYIKYVEKFDLNVKS